MVTIKGKPRVDTQKIMIMASNILLQKVIKSQKKTVRKEARHNQSTKLSENNFLKTIVSPYLSVTSKIDGSNMLIKRQNSS